MKEQISIDLFEHLVELAALELKADEAAYLRQQLNKQLQVIQELAAIPLDEEVAATSHGVAYTPEISQPLREDTWQAFDKSEKILAQVPQVEDGFIIVPDIPHSALE